MRMAALSGLVLVALAVAVLWRETTMRSSGVTRASTIGQASRSGRTERAIFAAGCFWGVEDAFRRMEGVLETRVGYTGGHMANPSYRLVCGDTTGHAEAVEVTYDPEQVSYEQLLERFWAVHDPTTPNRQGPDVGSQYRSAIFCADDGQRSAAAASKEQLERSGRFRRPIVTQILPAAEFWPAEEYHQQYAEKTGHGACHL